MQKKKIIEKMSKTKRHVMSSAFVNHVTNYDGTDAAASASGLPTAFIMAENGFVSLDPFRAVCPGLKTYQTLGWGHFCTLFDPDQVNSKISDFLGLI